MDWYLIIDDYHDGSFNMAFDESLAADPPELPVLRFYFWKPPAVSLGYNQKPAKIDYKKCDEYGIDVVRRPTGGRAVYHDKEITYSVIIPPNSDMFKLSIHELYYDISKALTAGLNSLGIKFDIERNKPADSKKHNNVEDCFSSAARFEIKYKGAKIVGSAQRRLSTAVIQHGSIILEDRQYILNKLFGRETEAGDSENGNTETEETRTEGFSLKKILNKEPDVPYIIEQLIHGFRKELNSDFSRDFNISSIQKSAEKFKDKYSIYRSNSHSC